MAVLVTGANGLVGHHLCERLLADGHEVLALTRSAAPALLAPLADRPGLHIVRADLEDAAAIDALFAGQRIEAVCHLAVSRWSAATDGDRPLTDSAAWRTNVTGTQHLYRAAARHGRPPVVHGSAMLVYDIDHPPSLPVAEHHPPAPAEPNGLTVLLGEVIARHADRSEGVATAILRFPGIYGRGKSGGVIATVARHCRANDTTPLRLPGNRHADFLFVGDAVDAVTATLQRLTAGDDAMRGGLFHIGSGADIAVLEAARMIRELTGSTAEIERDDAAEARRFRFDIRRARERLGYRPRPIETALADYLESLTESGAPARS